MDLLGDHVFRREVKLHVLLEVLDKVGLGLELVGQLLGQNVFGGGLHGLEHGLVLHHSIYCLSLIHI